MKDEFWSIRKMREDQKLSQSRNTYKERAEEQPVRETKVFKEQKPLMSGLFSRLQLFLEE
jgi:hypothetical protein